jgi:hypothetical protein
LPALMESDSLDTLRAVNGGLMVLDAEDEIN